VVQVQVEVDLHLVRNLVACMYRKNLVVVSSGNPSIVTLSSILLFALLYVLLIFSLKVASDTTVGDLLRQSLEKVSAKRLSLVSGNLHLQASLFLPSFLPSFVPMSIPISPFHVNVSIYLALLAAAALACNNNHHRPSSTSSVD
jgi:hypothetical protein